MYTKSALIILDGWGIGKDDNVSAIAKAKTPFVDTFDSRPSAQLTTFGELVGLPEGQMGNSEVGHLNIGAGRIVFQELARINNAIKDGSLAQNETLQAAIENSKNTTKKLHLMGLLSDGGVHSHINHLLALCDILKHEPIEVFIHVFLDGRDTSPNGGLEYLKILQTHIESSNAKIATITGRYFAMDRDNRWERVKKAYDVIVHGKGNLSNDILQSIQESYTNGITDEFIEPIQATENNVPFGNIVTNDTVLFFNFRTDRPRELTNMLTQNDFPEQDTQKLPLHFVTMTEYDQNFENIHVLFTKDNIKNTIGEVVANNGLTQIRIAETEKYPHVTFFFSGGQEQPFNGEERILVNSPKVATYDLQPEMSAPEVTEKLIAHVKEQTPDFICLNYANTDMVGHTGIMKAAITAAETVDDCLSKLVPVLEENEYDTIIIADHGNSDVMQNPDGSPHTAHTTNMVPVWYIGKRDLALNSGKLGDVAPTLLDLMGIQIPEEMTGDILTKTN